METIVARSNNPAVETRLAASLSVGNAAANGDGASPVSTARAVAALLF